MKTCIFIAAIFLSTAILYAQDDVPDYLRHPVLPVFTLLKTDSTVFTQKNIDKNKKVLIMLFSPDCGYCKIQTDSIIAGIAKLKDVEIIMATFEPMPAITAFYKQYRLERFSNITLGRDTRYFFPPFYEATGTPFLALYDEKRKLVTTFNTSVPLEKILAAYEEKTSTDIPKAVQ
jgi:thiol-disulfide isomerase/thioredoxin